MANRDEENKILKMRRTAQVELNKGKIDSFKAEI